MTENLLAVSGQQGQRILRLYHLYRLLIGFALVLLISSDLDGQLLEIAHVQLFRYASWVYLTLNIIAIASMHRTDHLLPIFTLAVCDVAQLSLLFYAAGGVPSGIGNLIIVAVAVANILLRGRIGIFIAAVASAGIIYLTFYLSISNAAVSNQYMQAGILGTLCFAAAFFVQGLSRRLRVSESLAEQRAGDVAHLEEFSALIIQRLHTGILVLDAQHRGLQRSLAPAAPRHTHLPRRSRSRFRRSLHRPHGLVRRSGMVPRSSSPFLFPIPETPPRHHRTRSRKHPLPLRRYPLANRLSWRPPK